MEGSNSKADFEDKKTSIFSTESNTPCDISNNFKKLIPHTVRLEILKYFQNSQKKKLYLFTFLILGV